MKVTHLIDKGSGPVNEDSYLITKNLYGVFDGATGLIKYIDANGNTGGLLASQTAKEIFKKNQDKPFMDSVKEISAILMKKMREANINLKDKAGFFATSATVVRITDKLIEYLQIGDSPIIFVGKDGSLQTSVKDHDMETLLLWKQLAKKGVKDIRHNKRIEEKLLSSRREINVRYGFLNGEDNVLNFLVSGSLQRDRIKNVILFTDGMIIPKENPKDPEDFQTVIQLFKVGGLSKIKNYVREIENSDPDCLKYPRFKQHDDLTAIAITL